MSDGSVSDKKYLKRLHKQQRAVQRRIRNLAFQYWWGIEFGQADPEDARWAMAEAHRWVLVNETLGELIWAAELAIMDEKARKEGTLVLLEHTDVWLRCHHPSECAGRPCPLHHRTDHVMRGMRQHWRASRVLMERVCEHGVGHPDVDAYPFYYETFGKRTANAEFVHGCCHEMCCQPAPEWMEEYR